MNNWKKAAKVILIATAMTGMITSFSYGASRKKITSVNVNIESKVELGTKYGDEEIEVDNIPSTLLVSSPMPQLIAEEAGVEEID